MKSKITARTRADRKHDVVTVVGEGFNYRRMACQECPWRKDTPRGAFPAKAFCISAKTAYDRSDTTFACHMTGTLDSAVCAGFLLRGADHNMRVRAARAFGQYTPIKECGVEFYENYREMAIANGVAPDDPALAPCRGGYDD